MVRSRYSALVFPQRNGNAPSANLFEFYRAPVTKATVKAMVIIKAINTAPDLALLRLMCLGSAARQQRSKDEILCCLLIR